MRGHPCTSVRMIQAMTRFEGRTVKEMLAAARRPELVKDFNDHPEKVEALLARAEFNRRWTREEEL